VSEETAVAMARGARARLGVDVAIATTGVAGPDGGTAEKPVGLMWMALAHGAEGIETRRLTFPGERSDIHMRGTIAALSLVWRNVNDAATASV
jgi:PncC family amidohydrolase